MIKTTGSEEILNLQLQIFVMDMWQIFSDKCNNVY